MKGRSWKNGLRMAILLFVAIGLLAGMSLPVAAAPGDPGQPAAPASPPRTIAGKVTDIAANKSSFTVQPAKGDPIVIAVDANTKYFKVGPPRPAQGAAGGKQAAPRPNSKPQGDNKDKDKGNAGQGQGNNRGKDAKDNKGKAAPPARPKQSTPEEKEKAELERLNKTAEKATFDDIAKGDRVNVRLMPNGNLAKWVIIHKKPPLARVAGKITAVGADSITIAPATGTSITAKWDSKTRFILIGLLSVQKDQNAVMVYNTTTNLAIQVTVKPATAT